MKKTSEGEELREVPVTPVPTRDEIEELVNRLASINKMLRDAIEKLARVKAPPSA